MNTVIYPIHDSLYINLTNRCTCRCQFCPLGLKEPLMVQGFDLKLTKEPTTKAILAAIEQYQLIASKPKEIVFCGYGEPTLRLKELKEIATQLKKEAFFIRLNTNGHANIIHKRNVVPELKGLIDQVVVSLNACSSEEYEKINQPIYPYDVYPAVKEFILECKKVIPKVLVSAVGISGMDLKKFQKVVTDELGVALMLRELNQQGVPQTKNIIKD